VPVMWRELMPLLGVLFFQLNGKLVRREVYNSQKSNFGSKKLEHKNPLRVTKTLNYRHFSTLPSFFPLQAISR